MTGNAELQNSAFLKDRQRSHSLGLGVLGMDVGTQCKLSPSGLLAFEHSGPLALLPAQMGVLKGPGNVGPTRDLDPELMGAHS